MGKNCGFFNKSIFLCESALARGTLAVGHKIIFLQKTYQFDLLFAILSKNSAYDMNSGGWHREIKKKKRSILLLFPISTPLYKFPTNCCTHRVWDEKYV